MFTQDKGCIRLFRLAGITVFLHWSWFLVAVLELKLRRDKYNSLVWNAAEYLTLFGIVLLHEFGHALACRSGRRQGRADRPVAVGRAWPSSIRRRGPGRCCGASWPAPWSTSCWCPSRSDCASWRVRFPGLCRIVTSICSARRWRSSTWSCWCSTCCRSIHWTAGRFCMPSSGLSWAAPAG